MFGITATMASQISSVVMSEGAAGLVYRFIYGVNRVVSVGSELVGSLTVFIVVGLYEIFESVHRWSLPRTGVRSITPSAREVSKAFKGKNTVHTVNAEERRLISPYLLPVSG